MVATNDQKLLVAARAGDEAAFRALVEPHRRGLLGRCRAMLGTAHDAEDALQDSLLRAWRALEAFSGRSSFGWWLHRIATNVCLSVIRQRASEQAKPLADPVPGAEAAFDQRESLELAFVAAQRHLPPNQRASLILTGLGFTAREVAGLLGTTTPSVTSALQRARKTIGNGPRRDLLESARAVGDRDVRVAVAGYMRAIDEGDIDAMVAMLCDEAAWPRVRG